MSVNKKVRLGLLSLLTVGLIAACGSEASSSEDEAVKVGVNGDIWVEMWKGVAERAAEDGYAIEVVSFSDINQPYEALTSGDIDASSVGHYALLNEFNTQSGQDHVAIGETIVSPLAIYSLTYDSLAEIPEGGTVAIPSEPTTGGRALQALESQGLLALNDVDLPYVEDIVENPKNIQIVELDPAQLVTSLPDVDASVLMSVQVEDAGMSIDDAIFKDTDYPESIREDQKNVIMVTKENEGSAQLAKLADYFQTDETAAEIDEITNGMFQPVWTLE